MTEALNCPVGVVAGYCVKPGCGQELHPNCFAPPFLCHNHYFPWQEGNLTLLVNEAQIIGFPCFGAATEFQYLRILVGIREDGLVAIPAN